MGDFPIKNKVFERGVGTYPHLHPVFGEEGSERGTLLAHLVFQPAAEGRRTPFSELLLRRGYRLFLCECGERRCAGLE